LCNFTLVFVEVTSDTAEILKDTHYLHIKINIDKDLPSDWQTTQFNWGKIFLDIEKNL